MHDLLRLIQSTDVRVYYFLSQFHGNRVLDSIFAHIESNLIFKSCLLIGAYWYFWFRNDLRQKQRRSDILVAITGTIVGLTITRLIATFATFRIRPMYDANLLHRSLSISIPNDFVNWSSFPSDHAAYLAGLGVGLILLYRRLALPIALYIAFWICLPRLYLGIHFLSDVVVGALIGTIAVCVSMKLDWMHEHVGRPLLALSDAKPQWFYVGAFLVMHEMATIFADLRRAVVGLLHVVAMYAHHKRADIAVLAIILCVVVVVISRSFHSPQLQHNRAFANSAGKRS